MKESRPWHKRFHGDAITGYMGLTLEERGAYSTLLDYLYDRRAPLPGNIRLLAGFLDVSVRKAGLVLETLIEKGKLYRRPDGSISNKRFEKEVENSAKTSDHMAEIGSSGGNKSAEKRKKDKENNDPQSAPLDGSSTYARSQKPEARSRKKETRRPASAGDASASSAAPPSQPVVPVVQTDLTLAVEAYNEAASHCPHKPNSYGNAGWAICASLTANRSKAVSARLKDVGLAGWRAAVERGAQSDFLSGRAKRQPGRESWGVDIGWLAKAENFAKLTEGKYDNDRGRVAPVGQASAREGLMQFLREDEREPIQ